MKYRNIPTEVEAVQFLGKQDDIPMWSEAESWLLEATQKNSKEEGAITIGEYDPHEGYSIPRVAAYLTSPEGFMALAGDYVVRMPKGNLVTMSRDFFESSYEPLP